ncbi:MAG: acetoin utilization protein AcuC [Elusimicrobia bacterium]|nr:acetoin utilization protein AcuC [Candidatus Obscuribacterium magneticum]
MTMNTCKLINATALPPYDLGANHPFARDRQKPLFDLLNRMKLVTPEELFVPPETTDEDLALGHESDYIEIVKKISVEDPDIEDIREAQRYGFNSGDNPISPNLHTSAGAAVGGTLGCVRAVMKGEAKHAFNPAGGLHHAMPRSASGFCVYNDLVIGIREAKRIAGDTLRVLYVDVDVHHGDGVQFAFYEDPTVLTISFHEDPRYLFPGTGLINEVGGGKGIGACVNVPLAPGTGDDSWIHCIEKVLNPLARRFKPDLIVSQHGCDTHREDPLAHLHVTTKAMHEAARLVHHLANDLCQGRWVAAGGGGYRPYHVIPRAWSLVWMEMSGRKVPDGIDAGWIEKWQKETEDPLPTKFYDAFSSSYEEKAAARANEKTFMELKALIGIG